MEADVIITVGGIKGGTGKSTAATNLAVMRRRAGFDVMLVDADEQKSASEFVAQREALGHGTIPCVQLVGKTVLAQVREMKARYADIIIDTGGRDTASQRSALLASDVLLLPFQPGNFDLWTIEQVETMANEIRSVNEGLAVLAYISRGYPAGTDNEDAAGLLRESTVLRLLDVTVIGRKAYNAASGRGLAVVEAERRDPKAVAEMDQLYNAVFGSTAATASA